MTQLQDECKNLFTAMEVAHLRIPTVAVKFYFESDTIPEQLLDLETVGVSVTSCQANKMAGLGDAILLTEKNIGCIAAAITFGLVDQHQQTPMKGNRVYTDIMKEQLNEAEDFSPATPEDFTNGSVYACKDSGRKDFCLFGANDSGRFKDTATARKGIAGMLALQPAKTKGVFFFPPEFDDIDIEPDVIVMSVRPVELTRLAEGYQFLTGERVEGSMGAVRVVNSDLIVRPYIQKRINFSSYCIGARLIGNYEPDKLGLGMPYSHFQTMVQGVEESRTGYPFALYPGATG